MTQMQAPSSNRSTHGTKPSARRVQALRGRVRGRPGGALGWRIGATIVGVVVVVVGVVLLPLPGPGWLVIFAGLRILATEYTWAQRLLGFAQHQVQRWTDWVKHRSRGVQVVIGLLGVVFLVAVFVAGYLVLYA